MDSTKRVQSFNENIKKNFNTTKIDIKNKVMTDCCKFFK